MNKTNRIPTKPLLLSLTALLSLPVISCASKAKPYESSATQPVANAPSSTTSGATSGGEKTPIVYPAKGQSQEQQQKDVSSCHQWATNQTGFDPYAAVEQEAAAGTSSGSTSTSPGRSAAGGAAGGAIIGGITGHPGAGAAAGAATGGLVGRKEKKEEQSAQQKQQQQSQAQLQTQIDNFNRATTACLESRGYTVQ